MKYEPFDPNTQNIIVNTVEPV